MSRLSLGDWEQLGTSAQDAACAAALAGEMSLERLEEIGREAAKRACEAVEVA